MRIWGERHRAQLLGYTPKRINVRLVDEEPPYETTVGRKAVVEE